jgi:hypothetical protein
MHQAGIQETYTAGSRLKARRDDDREHAGMTIGSTPG